MKKTSTGKTSPLVAGLFVALIISIVLLFANFAYLSTQANHDKQYLEHAGELRVLSQRISTNASEAATGKPEAFNQLKAARNEFERRWDILRNGNELAGLPPSSLSVAPQMEAVQAEWDRVRKSADDITASEQTVLSLHQLATTLAQTIPQLQVEYDEIVNILLERKAPAEQVAVAQRQSLLAERILGSVNKVLAGDQSAVQAADSFGRDASMFGRVLNAMLEGNASMNIAKVTDPEAVSRLNEVNELFEFVSGNVDEILGTSSELLVVREAANQIFASSQQLLTKASDLAQGYGNVTAERRINVLGNYVLGLIALVSIISIGLIIVKEARQRLAETNEKNQRNQAAILRLLDEIADLADGDLTVEATVTEDFTGAIADSINYSIDQLRDLVKTINQTAVQVSAAAQETQSTAIHLAEASEHQAQEIAGASAAVNEMAVSIDQVSANASESTAVAERSVSIANKGNQVVHNTIVGMDNIREQIQDTSKRIKRLGESSQEIGDIVSLINDIADQTNILALNAAIQASMAGDAGRGFAVVADEVRALAHRTQASTGEIESMISTVRAGADQAVEAMVKSQSLATNTQSLAIAAGDALTRITEGVSQINERNLVIASASEEQAQVAREVDRNLVNIQDLSAQTAAGANQTSASSQELSRLATSFNTMVARFKL